MIGRMSFESSIDILGECLFWAASCASQLGPGLLDGPVRTEHLEDTLTIHAMGERPRQTSLPIISSIADSAWFTHYAPVLSEMLEGSGFSNVVRCELNRSEDVTLGGLANEGRMPDGFLEMEPLTLKGIKLPGTGIRHDGNANQEGR